MTCRMSRSLLAPVALVGVLTGSYGAEPPPADPGDAQAIAGFQTRVKEYLVLHSKLESTLPRLPRKPTAEQIDKDQRALGDLIKSARSHAKPGEFFTPGMKAFVKRVLDEVLSGPDGKALKGSIMDENPGVPSLVINERYPSSVPLSTMPPQVLAVLPKLPQELEYRFIGSRLILLDIHADIILDFAEGILAP